MTRSFRVKHKPTGKIYDFDLDQPPEKGIEKALFELALQKKDLVLKKSNVSLNLRYEDIEVIGLN